MADETPETPETIVDEVEKAAAPGTPAPAAEPDVQLPPKERRAARRAAKAPAPSAPKTAEERQAERDEQRRHKAKLRRTYRAKARTKRAERRAAEPAGEPVLVHEHGPGRPKVRQGVVVSDKADKTITVRIDTARRHQRYHKIMRTSSTLHAHDEANTAHTGDTVRVIESRPLSRTKRWRLVDVVERAR